MKPQTQTVLEALQSGQRLTQTTARQLGVRSLAARICELRQEGYSIYTNTTSRGTNYRLGAPSRKMVAIAHAVAGTQVFR
jgi:hypothetical protein